MSQDIRWKQRFENFKKAYGYFKASIVDEDPHSFSIREKLGVVQEFEMILELVKRVFCGFGCYFGGIFGRFFFQKMFCRSDHHRMI